MLTTQLTAHDAFACHHSHYQMLRDAILQNTFCHKILFSTVSHVLFKRLSAHKIFDYHFYTICRNKYSLACNYSSRKQSIAHEYVPAVALHEFRKCALHISMILFCTLDL